MLYFIVLCITLVVTLLTMIRAFKAKDKLVYESGIMLLSSALIAFFYIIVHFSDRYEAIIYAKSGIFIAIDLITLAGLEYLMEITKSESKYKRIFRIILYLYGGIDVILLLSNPYFGICATYDIDTTGIINVVETIGKLPFKLHLLYIYVVVAMGVILLIRKCKDTPKIYWYKYYVMVLGILAATGVNCVFLFDIVKLQWDMSVVFYALIALIFYENAVRSLPYGAGVVTRKLMIEYMGIPVILFDTKDYIMDYNRDAEAIFGKGYLKRGKTGLKEFIYDNKMFEEVSLKSDMECEWTSSEGKPKIYNCTCKRIKDNENEILGRILVLRDITSLREAYSELEYSIIYDSLTGLYNRYSLKKKVVELNKLKGQSICVGVCNINGMKTINEVFGRQRGDEITVEFARILQSKIDESSFLAKVEDGNFVVVFFGVDEQETNAILEDIRNEVKKIDVKDVSVDIEYGIHKMSAGDISVEDAIAKAKASMLNKKLLSEASNSSSLIGTLKNALNESDFETEEHVERTKELARKLGVALQLNDTQMGQLALLAVLHDIGKIATPATILTKPDKLNEDEWEIMKQHTIKGYRIVKTTTELAPIAECVLAHHERWDGKGYPSGLKGVNIPLLSRIIAVVDAYDVMTHDRPYHKAISEQEAREELKKCAGTQFDPAIVDIFLSMGDDI